MLASGLLASLAAALAPAQTATAPNRGPPAVTSLSMMASVLPCSDLDRSIAFYTKGLGMSSSGRIEMPSGTEAPLAFPGGGAMIMLFKPRAEGAVAASQASLHRLVLAVPDLKAVEAALIAAGYRLKGPIAEQAKYHVAVGQVDDPDGNHLELVQRLP
jgi:catechol 2,3-dioxygenase-like lactoylglutathione lyase family enzyme